MPPARVGVGVPKAGGESWKGGTGAGSQEGRLAVGGGWVGGNSGASVGAGAGGETGEQAAMRITEKTSKIKRFIGTKSDIPKYTIGIAGLMGAEWGGQSGKSLCPESRIR
jgi:hypothetical protein